MVDVRKSGEGGGGEEEKWEGEGEGRGRNVGETGGTEKGVNGKEERGEMVEGKRERRGDGAGKGWRRRESV